MVMADDVDAALRAAGVPITGVSVPSDNKETWRVEFTPEATQADRDTAAAVIAAFVIPTPNTLFDKFAEVRLNEKAIKSWAKAIWEAIPAPVTDWNDTKQRAKTIFKNGNGA